LLFVPDVTWRQNTALRKLSSLNVLREPVPDDEKLCSDIIFRSTLEEGNGTCGSL
jgi:hypothetical protein